MHNIMVEPTDTRKLFGARTIRVTHGRSSLAEERLVLFFCMPAGAMKLPVSDASTQKSMQNERTNQANRRIEHQRVASEVMAA